MLYTHPAPALSPLVFGMVQFWNYGDWTFDLTQRSSSYVLMQWDDEMSCTSNRAEKKL